jgi:hypothetical protein
MIAAIRRRTEFGVVDGYTNPANTTETLLDRGSSSTRSSCSAREVQVELLTQRADRSTARRNAREANEVKELICGAPVLTEARGLSLRKQLVKITLNAIRAEETEPPSFRATFDKDDRSDIDRCEDE